VDDRSPAQRAGVRPRMILRGVTDKKQGWTSAFSGAMYERSDMDKYLNQRPVTIKFRKTAPYRAATKKAAPYRAATKKSALRKPPKKSAKGPDRRNVHFRGFQVNNPFQTIVTFNEDESRMGLGVVEENEQWIVAEIDPGGLAEARNVPVGFVIDTVIYRGDSHPTTGMEQTTLMELLRRRPVTLHLSDPNTVMDMVSPLRKVGKGKGAVQIAHQG